MKKFFLIFGFLLLAATAVSAQERAFVVKNASKLYDVKIRMAKCDKRECNDRGTVYLFKKNQKEPFQTIEMEEIYLSFDSEKELGAVNELKHDEIYGFGFADYNFDGVADFIVSNGRYGPYSDTSYDIYLFSNGKFVKNKALTELATDNMTLDVNNKGRYLEAFTKSGCCWHQTTRYRYVGKRLVKFYVMTEEMSNREGKKEVTIETLVGKRWKKRTIIRSSN